jgi:hypothetical protein
MYWIIQGILHGIILYFVCVAVVSNNVMRADGYSDDIWTFSLILFSSVTMVYIKNNNNFKLIIF